MGRRGKEGGREGEGGGGEGEGGRKGGGGREEGRGKEGGGGSGIEWKLQRKEEGGKEGGGEKLDKERGIEEVKIERIIDSLASLTSRECTSDVTFVTEKIKKNTINSLNF